MHSQIHDDKRLVEFRKSVMKENMVGTLKVFLGGVGLMFFLLKALAALVQGTGLGLFSGSMSEIAVRFGKFAFFLACLLGLFPAWRDYSESNAKECSRRREMLARIESEPDWWRKKEEERQQRTKDEEELVRKLIEMGYDPDADPWREAFQRSQDSLANLTRQIRDARPEEKL